MESILLSVCGPITGPITDTATYTYSNLDAGFTPPESCLQLTYTSIPVGYDAGFTSKRTLTIDDGLTTSTEWVRIYRGRDPACFPSKYPKACEYQGTVQQQQNYIYSPGTCPGGYAPATTAKDESASTITTATCCPSGYVLTTMRANAGDTFWGDPVSCTSTGQSFVFREVTATFSPGVLALFAPTVVVAWQSSDIARWGNGPATSSPTGSLSASDPSTGSESGLSTGAKAGIGVGCALVAIAAAVILLLFTRHRNQKRRRAGNVVSVIHEEGKSPVKGKGGHVELADGAALQEMAGHGRRRESNGMNVTAELE